MRTQPTVRIGLTIGLMIGAAAITGLQAYAQNAKAIVTKSAAIYTGAKTYQATYTSVITAGTQGAMNMKMDLKMTQSKKNEHQNGDVRWRARHNYNEFAGS